MKARLVIGTALFAALLAACGSSHAAKSSNNNGNASSTKTTAPPVAPAVGVGSSGLGNILVDSQGRTVYMFGADSGTTSACTGPCAAAWPPVQATGAPTAGNGANAALVATIGRSDGTVQVTYNGHPLYTFVGDHQAGDTNGQGRVAFGSRWSALSPAGAQISAPANSPGSTAPPPPRASTAPTAPMAPKAPAKPRIPQNGGGDGDADNHGGPDDGDGGV